jgi:hypothetical protein
VARLKAKARGYTPHRREEEIQFQEQVRDEIQFLHEPGGEDGRYDLGMASR